MNITVATTWVITVLLLAIRFGVLFILSPIPAFSWLPAKFRLLLVLSLAVIMASLVQHPLVITDLGAFTLGALNEFCVGALLAFGVYVTFAIFQVAGRMIDFQMGLSAASVLNPATKAQDSLIGTFLTLLATMIFFSIGGLGMMLQGLAYSIKVLPPSVKLIQLPIQLIIADSARLFAVGLSLAAPVVFGLLLVDIGGAVVARNIPQINIYFVSLPIKIFLGLLLTALTLSYMGPAIERLFSHLFHYWNLELEYAHG